MRPYAAGYLYELGSAYYRFEEWDKALGAFLDASHYPFYISRDEINNYNVIGLIYACKTEWGKATLFYRIAIAKAAAYPDTTWAGIASGNLGAVFLQKGQNDSALFITVSIITSIAGRIVWLLKMPLLRHYLWLMFTYGKSSGTMLCFLYAQRQD